MVNVTSTTMVLMVVVVRSTRTPGPDGNVGVDDEQTGWRRWRWFRNGQLNVNQKMVVPVSFISHILLDK